MVRFAPKHLHGNYRLFDLAIATFQMPFSQEPEEPAQPFVANETKASQDPF